MCFIISIQFWILTEKIFDSEDFSVDQMSEIDPRLASLSNLFRREFPPQSHIKDVFPQLASKITGFELTGDAYLDFSLYCAQVLIDCAPKITDDMVSIVNVMRYMTNAVINWGIYPHLPKSLHIPFMDDPHWVFAVAPPRLLRPKDEMLQALEMVIRSPGLSLIHPLFLQHAICIFYFLDKAKVSKMIEYQPTENVFSALLALLPTGLKVSPIITSLVMERKDILTSLEKTSFPPHVLARAIAAPANKDEEDHYYEVMFPRFFEALRSEQGAIIAKFAISNIIKQRPQQFLKNCPLDLLLNWPTESSIGPIIWNLDIFVFSNDCPKIIVPPIPQRLLFIAAQTTGDIQDRAIRLIKNTITEYDACNEFVNSIIRSETLTPLELDLFKVEVNEEGIFIVEDDREDDFDILENMRKILGNIIDLKYVGTIFKSLPITLAGIHLVSILLMRYKEINPDDAVSLLTFISKIEGTTNIARSILEMCPKLKSIPIEVVNAFGNDIPELGLLKILNPEKVENKIGFDISELINDLNNPVIPLRARGLYVLRRGILENDHPLRDENMIKSLFPTIEKQLQHKDTFVFLNAITCLSTIAEVFPHLVIEKLAAQYPQKDEGVSLKVAQILMVCVRRSGPGLIHSADGNLCGFFIKAFARGVSHDSSLVQASSLSDLASFVEALSFGCFPWFADIVKTVDTCWQAHHTIDVRRAASYLGYKIVLTFGDKFDEFSKDDLQVLIEVVKRNRDAEFDDVAHQNAEDCYQTLWDCCPKAMLSPDL